MNQSGNIIPLGGQALSAFTPAGAISTHVIDADGEMIAFSFIARSTIPITAVNAYLRLVGTPDNLLIIGIQSDNAGSPSGTYLGATGNAKTAATQVTGTSIFKWVGELTLGETTGDLTVNTRYWVVISETTNTALDGANYYQTVGSTVRFNGETCKNFAVTWGSVANRVGCFTLKRGTYYGNPVPQAYIYLATNNIWCDSDTSVDWRQGIRYKIGVAHYCVGIQVIVDYVGTPPEGLIFDLFEGTTLKQSTPEIEPASALLVDVVSALYLFPTPVLLTAGATIYIIGRQATSTGGAAANSFDIPSFDLGDDNYASCLVDPDMTFAFGYGSGADPTALTWGSARYVPQMVPVITNAVDDLVMPTAGKVLESETTMIGTYHEATVAEVQLGVTFGALSALTGTYAGGGQIMIDGAWKTISSIFMMIAGAWKQITS